MKLTHLWLPKAAQIGALGKLVQYIAADRDNCEIEYDPRSGAVSVFKGERVSLILSSGAIAELAEDQPEEKADAGAPRSASAKTSSRARTAKPTPPVQT